MEKQQGDTQGGQEPRKRGVLELVVDADRPVLEDPSGETDELADPFFDEKPASFPPQEIWGEELSRAPRRSRGSRFAQYTTFAMLGAFLIGIGSYTFYARVIMPTPVEVGLAGTLQSPFSEATGPKSDTQPLAASEVARAAAKQPAAGEVAEPESLPENPEASVASAPEPAGEATGTSQGPAQAAAGPGAAVEKVRPVETAPVVAVPVSSTLEPADRPAAAGAERAKPKARAAQRRPVRSARKASPPARRAVATATRRRRAGRRQSEPNRADVLRKMAYHYLNEGRHREAERYASQAVGADPRNSQGWILLGLARDALQDLEGAKSAFQRCTQAEGPYVSECRRLKGGYM
jgi:hypothetical protein